MTLRKFKLGSVTIDAQAYGSQGNAILGIRDSGKTYTATEIAEKLFEAGIPFIAFDPTGVWRWLRVPGKGRDGRGYPVVVAGGRAGDLPLTVSGAVEIVRAAMKNGVSLVIDLTDPNLSKADWKRIVKSCVRVLLQENADHGLRHIFIEEAAEFAPQKVIDGDVYAEVEKLARIGGNSRLGYTLVNQRSQEVNKAVLELCENLFLHRQKGKNAILSLDHWLNVAGVDQAEIVKSLPRLPSGQCWAWMGGETAPTLVTVPPKNSFHPDRRTMHGAKGKNAKKAVNVGSFVKDMKAALVHLEAEHAAKDPVKLQAKVAELTKKIDTLERAAATAKPAAPDKDAIAAAEQRGFDQAKKKATREAEKIAHDKIIAAMEAIERLIQPVGVMQGLLAEQIKAMRRERIKLDAPLEFSASPAAVPKPAAATQRHNPVRHTTPAVRAAADNGHGSGQQAVKPAQQKVLDAVAWWRKIGIDPVPRVRVAVVAGYSPNASTTDVYIAGLLKMGLLENAAGGGVSLTSEGLSVANTPAGGSREELREMARALLKPKEAAIFDIVYESGSEGIRRDDVAVAANLSMDASTVDVYLAAVARFGIIENVGGKRRPAPWLFP